MSAESNAVNLGALSRVKQGAILEDFSLQPFRFAFGNGCDHPNYVVEMLEKLNPTGKEHVRGRHWRLGD